MATADLTGPEVADLDAVAAQAFIGNVLQEKGPLRAFYRWLDWGALPHRAEADARGLADAWGETLRAKDRSSGTGSER